MGDGCAVAAGFGAAWLGDVWEVASAEDGTAKVAISDAPTAILARMAFFMVGSEPNRWKHNA